MRVNSKVLSTVIFKKNNEPETFKIFLKSLNFIGINVGDIGNTIHTWDTKFILLDACDL